MTPLANNAAAMSLLFMGATSMSTRDIKSGADRRPRPRNSAERQFLRSPLSLLALVDMPNRRRGLLHGGLAALFLFALEGSALAETPYLVKNIAGVGTSSIAAGTMGAWSATVGSTLLFAATTGGGFVEVWKSDGTSAGTTLLASVAPGNTAAGGTDGDKLDPAPTVGGVTFFHAKHPVSGNGVWKTDGTGAGTTLVASTPLQFGYGTAWGSKVLFAGSSGALWITDGTSTGTKTVKSFYGTRGIVGLNDSTAISISTVGLGYQAYMTDGATSVLITGSPFNSFFTGGENAVIGGSALFIGDGGLWKTDGTSAGTALVSASVFNATHYAKMGGTTYFIGNGNALWKTDGTSAGTALVKSVLSSSRLVAVGSTLYFVANSRDLWKSDGTAAGTVLVKNLSSVEHLTVFAGKVYFSGGDSTNGKELWSSDGTGVGTTLVADISPGTVGSSPSMFRAVGTTLFFAADDGTTGRELWALTAPTAGDAGVSDSGSIDAATDTAPDTAPDVSLDVATDSVADTEIAVDATGDTGDDATIAPDAPSTPDVGADTNTTEPAAEPAADATDSGCGCSVPASNSDPSSLLLIAALIAISRRAKR
jgi:ELWxxDGT repeat protein